MRKPVVRILALVTLTACAGSCMSGCKKKYPFPEEDSFTTYTHPLEERRTADDIPFLADESEYLANLHDVPDHITFLPADDEKLIDHYKVPSDNMFGLKEIYVYENTVAMIFDQKTFDAIDTLYNFDRNPEWAEDVWTEEDIEENVIYQFERQKYVDGWATTVSGKDRICIVKIFYSEAKKKEIEEEPDRYFGRGYVSILGRDIDFNYGNISLHYMDEFTADYYCEHYQTYDSKTGKWGEEKLNEYYG